MVTKTEGKQSKYEKKDKSVTYGSTKADQNSSSKSMKKSIKAFWKRRKYGSKCDETKWLLHQSISSNINNGSVSDLKADNKSDKQEKCKKVKEKKQKKNKSLLKRMGKIAVQTCRYMSLGSAPGLILTPTPYHYNYETKSYDYSEAYPYSYTYPDSQSYSPSLFF